MPGRISSRTTGIGVSLATVAILAAACGGSQPSSSSPPPPAATVPPVPAAVPTTSLAAPAPAMTLQTQAGSYGVWLADQADRTLYIRTSDQGMTSSCYGTCATAWPPLLATGPVAADLGTTTRTDGTTQVTFAGHPLYYFAKETGPDQVLGLGAQGVWFLMTPGGAVIKPPVAMAPPPRMMPPRMPRMTKPRMMPPPPMTRPKMG